MREQFLALIKEFASNLRDVLPVLAVVASFQLLVIREPMPELERRLGGAIFTLIGLTFFVRGLAMSIFPLGDAMADWLARRGSLPLLVGFGFAIGFGSTIAEPALIAVTGQATSAVAAAGHDLGSAEEIIRFSTMLRYTVAAAVGIAVALGSLRVVQGWPVAWFVLPGYGVATLLAVFNPSVLTAIAFDAGAAATSAINVPLMLALGVGLASMIRERNPLADGFGLVALASLMPMLAILFLAQFVG